MSYGSPFYCCSENSLSTGLRSHSQILQLTYRHEFERSQFYSPSQIKEIQFERVRCLLRHAARRCPFYARRFAAAGFDPDKLHDGSDLLVIPPLTKIEIQTNASDMVSVDWPRNYSIVNRTGGSTGTPIEFFMSRDRVCSRAAATWRHNRWAGYEIGDKVATLGGDERDHVLRKGLRRLKDQLLMPTLELNASVYYRDSHAPIPL